MTDRFWAKVRKTETCWLWTAARDSGGYGHVRWGGRTRKAHRVAYELLVGQIPDGLHIGHLCRNRLCVNPEDDYQRAYRERNRDLLRERALTHYHQRKSA